MPNWHELATMSHYQTAVAVKQTLQDGDPDNAMKGLEELIDALARSERRALRSQLMRLMHHVVKWQVQPERRSWSWIATIRNARREIADIQRETPSLTRWVIEAMWDDCLAAARDEAAGELNRRVPPLTLTWAEVFDDEYTLEED
jgi:hypothetical protein